MPTPWGEPPGTEAQIAANAQAVLQGIEAVADSRDAPSITMAQQWHRDLYDGIPKPYEYYAGEVRDTDPSFPDLIGYEVEVANIPGAPSAAVPALLAQFEQNVQAAVANLDPHIPVGLDPGSLDPSRLHAILSLAAHVHGIWIQIHPFANGNGRTARLWANWAALRYGLPPFVTVKPRPAHPYGAAALSSMLGDHTVMIAVMNQMLRNYLAALP